jgi:hypothetical protein
MRSTAVIAAAVLLAGSAIRAQEPTQKQQDEIKAKMALENVVMRVPFEKPVTGAPYSGDIVVSSSQTLADGNHISRSETSHVYRDGQGRMRREQNGSITVAVAGDRVSTRGTVVLIVDPVAGYSYSLDAEHKIAWRTAIGATDKVMVQYNAASDEALAKLKAEKEQLAARGRSGGDAPAEGGGDIARIKLERGIAMANLPPLEHATIDGLAVEGRKTSETIPAGKIGNELPITITNEEWTSTDLKVLVLTKHSDPRTGESTYHLTNVVRADPDPSLFIVPPDYTVKDTGIRRNNE